MTNLEIDERIAKLCGWKAAFDKQDDLPYWISPNEDQWFDAPNYSESLDACREFEQTFIEIELTEYAVQLRYIVTRNVEHNNEPKHPDTFRIPDGRYYCAKPHERCEAFLRMKGQWE